MSEIERRQRVVEHFKKSHPEAGEIVERIALYGHIGTDLVEVSETVLVLMEGLGEVAFMAGLVLFPVHATLDILNSWKAGERAVGLRGRAYGITSWAFGDPLPPPPGYLRSGISQAALQQAMKSGDREFQGWAKQAAAGAQSDAGQWQRAWKEGADGPLRNLDNMVTQKHVAKADCQVIFQAIGDNNRNALAMKIMTEMAKDLPAIEQSAFWAPPPTTRVSEAATGGCPWRSTKALN